MKLTTGQKLGANKILFAIGARGMDPFAHVAEQSLPAKIPLL
jgi:hypothetical protein